MVLSDGRLLFRPVVFEDRVALFDCCCSCAGMIKFSDVTDTAAAVLLSLEEQRAVLMTMMMKKLAGKNITAQEDNDLCR